MSKLLYVSASLFGSGSKSRLIAGEFLDAWRKSHPGATVVERHLEPESIPHLTQAAFAAVLTPADQRDDAQRRAVAFADALIEEIEAADTVLLAVPMYNFAVPSTFKAWIDHITRANRTFRYSASGPEGLLKGKKVFIVTGRGGVYTGDSPSRPMDFQEPYLRGMLGFLGLDDVSFIHIEGLARGPDAVAQGLERARRAIVEILPAAVAA